MEVPQRILSRASTLFLKLGVRSVTMDEIAKDLGISKKTIYQYYANKAEMVKAVAIDYFAKEEALYEKISQESENAIDEILRILRWTLLTFKNLSPNLILEVEKFYPESWKHFEQFQQEYLLKKIRQNLKWGIEEGLYRTELNVELVSKIRLIQVVNSLNPSYFAHEGFQPVDIQRVSVDLYLHSIISPKGLDIYNSRIEQFYRNTNTQKR